MSALINKKLLSEIPDLYTQEYAIDPICHVKLFTPDSNWTWYIIEYSQSNQDLCFGYVIGLENELGYFTPTPLSSVKGGGS